MNENLIMTKKDETVMKIVHYFITQEDYKPVIIRGVDNEIWLENFDAEYKLVRINVNYLHNNTQYKTDLNKTNSIRRSIKKKTYSLNMNVLNILVDYGENIDLIDNKDIKSVKLGNTNDIKKNKDLNEMFPKLDESLKMKKSDIMDFFKMTEEMNQKNKEEEKLYKRWNKGPSRFSITNILIALNFLLFFLMYIIGNGSEDTATLLAFGANYSILVQFGQVYRLVTSAFLHIGPLHIIMNMLALYSVGNEIEKFYGGKKYILIYFISAILGSLLSCVFNPGVVSAGASGAIFGLFGSLLYFGLEYRATLDGILRSPVMGVILFNLLIGFFIPGVDIMAHIGGLIGGFLMSSILGVDGKKKSSNWIHSFIILAILFIFLSYMLFVY